MDFSNEQISQSGRDAVKIAAVDKATANLTYYAVVFLNVIPLFLFLRHKETALFILLVACISGSLLVTKKIIFLLCKKKNVAFEFDAENFISDGEAVKWADMREITYKEFLKRSRYSRYHVTISYKSGTSVMTKEITENSVLEISSKETAQIIADKFYGYYGASHGVMLKKPFLFDKYELTQVSQNGVLQKDTSRVADSSIQTPKMFR